MGILNPFGKNGMFVCDGCREKFTIKIDKEQFNALKKKINKYQEKEHRCYMCQDIFKGSEGVLIDNESCAKSLEGTIKRSEDLYEKFKNGIITCDKCFKKIEFTERKINCPHCNAYINTKKFGKSIKLPPGRKLTFKIMIKDLRK